MVVENPADRFGDGPDDERFIVAGSGLIAMRYVGGEADVERLTDWAESVGWSASVVDRSPLGTSEDIVLTEISSGRSVTVQSVSYAVLRDGVFEERPLSDYEADIWDRVRDEQEKRRR